MPDQNYLTYTNTDNNDSTIGKFFNRNDTIVEGLTFFEFCKYDGETSKSNIDRIFEKYTEDKKQVHLDTYLRLKRSELSYLNDNFNQTYFDLPLELNTKLLIPKNNFKTELVFIKGKNLELKSTSYNSFQSKKLLELLSDENYYPIENLIREGRELSVEIINENCQVFLWSRALGKIIDISNFIQSLSTSKSEIGSFNISLSPITNLNSLNFINNQDVLNYFVLNQNRSNNLDFFYRKIQYNDIVFIRFEKLKLEKDSSKSHVNNFEVNQSELPDKVWDMIGLIDNVSQSSSYGSNDYVVNITGRDFYKLLIEDGSYFMSLRYLNNGESSFFFNKNDKWFKRNFGDQNGNSGSFEYYQFTNDLRTINDSVKFIINQLSNIEVLPDNQNIFSNYGDRRTRRYTFSNENEDEISDSVNGVWQIIKILVDKSLNNRRVQDASISYVDSTILEQFNKLCQKPFVEFFGDTFGDEFNFIVRKPPFTKSQIIDFLKGNNLTDYSIENNTLDITKNYLDFKVIELEERDIEGYNSLEWDDTFYSWYQIQPKDNMLGQASELMSGGLIGIIYFDELCQYYGNKRLIVPDNYLSINGMSHVESDVDSNNYRSYLLNDLKYLIDCNSYLPFTRRGSIVIPKGDRRIKRGMYIRVKPTNEIFYVDSVSHSLSFSSKKVDRSTTIQVSRGMVEDYIYGSIGLEDNGQIIEKGSKPKKFSYFDIIKIDIIDEAREYESTETKDSISRTSKAEYSVSIPITSGIAYRNNNPGNLMFANQPDATQGEFRKNNSISQPTYWAKFETPEKGFENVIRQVKLDTLKNITLSQFVNKYAPSIENPTNEILSFYITRLNKSLPQIITKDTKLTDINSFELAKLIVLRESSTKVLIRELVEVDNKSNQNTEIKTKKVVYDKKITHKLDLDQLNFFMQRKQFNLMKNGR